MSKRTVRLGLLGKIILFLTVTLVPLAAITWWISIRALTTNLTDEFTSKGTAIAKSLASSGVDLLLTRDASTVSSPPSTASSTSSCTTRRRRSWPTPSRRWCRPASSTATWCRARPRNRLGTSRTPIRSPVSSSRSSTSACRCWRASSERFAWEWIARSSPRRPPSPARTCCSYSAASRCWRSSPARCSPIRSPSRSSRSSRSPSESARATSRGWSP